MLNLFSCIFVTIMFSGVWLILSGHFSLFFYVCGSFSVFFVLLFFIYKDRLFEVKEFIRPVFFVIFCIVLVKDIVLNTIMLVKDVWFLGYNLKPYFIYLPVKGVSKEIVSLYSLAVILTPGTIVVFSNDNYIVIHALAKKYATDIDSIKNNKLINSVFRGSDI